MHKLERANVATLFPNFVYVLCLMWQHCLWYFRAFLCSLFMGFEAHDEKLSYLIDCIYKQVTVYQLSLFCTKAGRWFRDCKNGLLNHHCLHTIICLNIAIHLFQFYYHINLGLHEYCCKKTDLSLWQTT